MDIEDSIAGEQTIRNSRSERASSTSDHLVNTILDGRYLIERKLGSGGFGSVYLASDNKVVSRKIVVKVLHSKEPSEWSKKKFQQELEALARIDHPSVVGVLDCGETADSRPYIVMQYIDGVSLRTLITSDGMQFNKAANIIRQIGKALSAAHQAGILHRDLKPENIMVQSKDGEDYVKVIDFGVAKVKDSIVDLNTSKEMAIGTIAYMSPEQLSAERVTSRSDIYALGVIAYEMLTGKRPTNPESAFQLLEMQRSGIRVKPTDLRPGLSPTAENVILKALSFQADERYQRARDFGDLLADALQGDDEETLTPTKRLAQQRAPEAPVEPSLETAHVLFVDIVGYSKALIDDQKTQLLLLQEFVTKTWECRRAQSAHSLILLPTGDGMALVFFDDPEAPVKCAVELNRVLQTTPEIQVRMGIHSGLVYRMSDIKNNLNVAGGGINIAQRVMDCGDGGHILLSNRVADDLGQLARWSPYLHDLGNTAVKHGLVVHVFNLYGEDFGNPEVPSKLRRPLERSHRKTWALIATATIVLIALTAVGIYWAKHSNTTTYTRTTAPSMPAVAGPERSFTYWLTYQKMRNGQPDSEPRQSAGNDIFGNGWRFQFNLTSNESGALYLLNVGPGKGSAQEFDILFPLPGAGQSNPSLTANQIFNSDWARFVEQTGVERLWIIWSEQPVAELDAIFSRAAGDNKNPGVITNTEDITRIQHYLDANNATVIHDKERKQSTVKGHTNILVSMVELTHEAN